MAVNKITHFEIQWWEAGKTPDRIDVFRLVNSDQYIPMGRKAMRNMYRMTPSSYKRVREVIANKAIARGIFSVEAFMFDQDSKDEPKAKSYET